MSEFPKVMAKAPGRTKVAHNAREEVRYRWDGYKVVEPDASDASEGVTIEVTSTKDEPPAEHVELVDRLVTDLAADEKAHEVALADEAQWETNGGATKPSEDELKANAAEKAADPQAYVAKQRPKRRPAQNN